MPTLPEAIAAIKTGRKDEARVMLTQILALDQRNITALLWMTEVSSTDEERRKYLGRILEIDPNNAHARKGLDLLGKVDDKTSQNPATGQSYTVASPSSINPPEPIKMQDDSKKCPYCAEVIKADAIVCRFCHRDLTTSVTPVVHHNLSDSVTSSSKDATTPSVGIVVSIIIVALIIVGFLWADVGSRFVSMTTQVLIVGGDPTQVSRFGLISFVLAVANWIAARFVTRRRSSTSGKLTLLATIGCIGAVFASGLVRNNSILIAIPLYVVAVYLFNTVKQDARSVHPPSPA